MKKLIYIISFTLMGLIAASCNKNEGAYFPVPSIFSVTPATTQSVVKEGDIIELTVTAGNLGWWVESSTTWCKVSQKYGSGNGKVTLTIDKNESGVARQTQIIVNPTFKLEPVIIVINQQ